MGTEGQSRWDLVFPSGAPERIGDMFATAVVADAVRGYDADLAQTVETCRDWRCSYRTVFRGLTALAASSPAASVGIATEGLRSARKLLRLVTGATVAPLRSVDVEKVAEPGTLDTVRVEGTAKPLGRLEVPYRDTVLAEESLQRQLTEWRRGGIVEPGFAAAVERVIDHPEWLALPGFRVIVTGAAAELGPLRPLLRWGADVLGIDLPGTERWQELSRLAETGAGVLRYPVTADPGVDITQQFPALVHWIRAQLGAEVRPVFGLYANDQGSAGVRLATAQDVLVEDLLEHRPDAALAFLGSPIDCYAVPEEVVAEAHARLHGRGLHGADQNLLRLLSVSTLYRPSYRTTVTDHFGAMWGVADALVPSIGPNHVLAHRILRWRAVLAHTAGRTVSYTVAPPASTSAVRAERSLAAAYRGVRRFGVEVFEPATARTLLAAKLVADLMAPPAAPDDANPESLFAVGAAHGGLWRQPFEPHSMLPVATATGSVAAALDSVGAATGYVRSWFGATADHGTESTQSRMRRR
ncbi:hypothetical protein [Nocardia sp. NBC_01009]|uniref:hypothetical protein n=1 Tax=Nocardia sp. NBC_01009 TaxID=2975996 RepID=UPI003863D51E|nr:hypothetical protein OHA42_00985 [Nocardia sp. NBC_01009]